MTINIIRIFVYDGSTAALIPGEGFIIVPAVTPVLTEPRIANWQRRVVFSKPILLPTSSHVLRLNIHVGETVRCRAIGRKYAA